MLFLSGLEVEQWKSLRNEIEARRTDPEGFNGTVRPNLFPAFSYFIGAYLVDKGLRELGKRWFVTGATSEEGGYFSNAFMTSFLDRHDGRLIMPDVAFADPMPFVHFSTVPAMQGARERFVRCVSRSLPQLNHPLRIMDIGCGDGGLVVKLLNELLATAGKVQEVGEVLLVDPSPAMLGMAVEKVRRAFPNTTVKTANHRIEEVSDQMEARYDIALTSLAYHHMPLEKKRHHLEKLKPWIDHLVIFELDANNDLPEQYSPELALSVYQSYGSIIDMVFAHDAPVEVVLACVDRFLMTEAISFLTQPRGVRTDYHMLHSQWTELLGASLCPEFRCLCDSSCYSDDFTSLFVLHYGR